ncbi:MAG: trigger factor [Cellvibrionaceae bacterium]|nr:trigger factor [Cellvibrionaceae bacterium]
MQVSIETTTALERRITVAVPAAVLASKMDERIAEVAKTARINGFRKGKVPLKVVKKQYGEAIYHEVANGLIDSSYQEALTQQAVNPAGQAQIEIKTLETGKDFEYTATVEVYPEITLGTFEGFTATQLIASVDASDVDNMIEKLRDQKADFVAVERPAAEGDEVLIDFVGTKDGEAFEGGTGNDHTLILGSNTMIPGFEAGIIGLSQGEQRTLALTFPEDYQVETLKGAAVEFAITLHSIKEKQLPDVDDAFVKQFDSETLDELREKITANMSRELQKATRGKLKAEVMDQLRAEHQVALPAALVSAEIDALREQMMQQFGGASNKNLDLKALLPDDMFTERAEQRVALGLLIAEIIKQYELKADGDKVRAYIDDMAANYESPEEFVNYYYQNQQLLAGVESAVLEDQVVELILSKSTVTEKQVTYEEAVASPDQD